MKSTVRVPVRMISRTGDSMQEDSVAVEEPLEIRVGFIAGGERTSIAFSVTMRTPGQDQDLAAGFLFTEGVIDGRHQIAVIGQLAPNVVRVELAADCAVDLSRFERRTYVASSCGICGKASLESVAAHLPGTLPADGPLIHANVIHGLPEMLRSAQAIFELTGGLHAAALFSPEGKLVAVREDVGRHNALDKLIGSQFLEDRTPLHGAIAFVSGRTSFELAQKALRAGLPVLGGVGAPSSLAVELASEHDLTLLGFVREHRFTVYSGQWRVLSGGDAPERISAAQD